MRWMTTYEQRENMMETDEEAAEFKKVVRALYINILATTMVVAMVEVAMKLTGAPTWALIGVGSVMWMVTV